MRVEWKGKQGRVELHLGRLYFVVWDDDGMCDWVPCDECVLL